MKKVISLLTLLFVSTFALSAQGFVSFRLEAGPSFNFSKLSILNETFKKENMVGYHLGAYVDVPFSNGAYVSSGLTFSMKGGRYAGQSSTLGKGANSNITFHYLQIPVNFGYRLNVSRSIAVALQTGPYFSVALAGTAASGLKGAKVSYDIFKEGLADIFKPKRYDVGWGVQALAFYSRFYATVGLDFGFLNVFNKNSDKKLQEDNNKGFLKMNTMQCFAGIGICF